VNKEESEKPESCCSNDHFKPNSRMNRERLVEPLELDGRLVALCERVDWPFRADGIIILLGSIKRHE